MLINPPTPLPTQFDYLLLCLSYANSVEFSEAAVAFFDHDDACRARAVLLPAYKHGANIAKIAGCVTLNALSPELIL
jgi:hypothetical protein